MKRLLAVFVVLALVGSIALAAPRTWKSGNGRFSTEAELLDFKDGKAQLKKGDGKTIEVPLLSLSPEDRQFIKSQFPGVEEEHFRPGVEYRDWKSKAGKFSITAEFLGYSDGKVQLRKSDGSEVSVEKIKLGTVDQKWITDELRRLREEEEESKTADKSGGDEPTGQLAAQEIAMKLLRLDPPKGKARSKAGVPTDYVLRLTTPQLFYMQTGRSASEDNTAFRSACQKEPKYNAPIPFRGVAKIGSRQYAFALDAVGPQAAAGYNKLYFDVNGNGDLTDDKPFTAVEVSGASGAGSQSQFPRVDLAAEVEGKTLEYSFLLSALCRPATADISVSLYSAVVREGYITQGTKRTKLLLLDHNSNGRFDDMVSLRGATAAEGDLLLINPNPKDKLSADATMGRDRNFVSKTVCIGNNFYKMEVPPSGDPLTLTPTKLNLGIVSNASPAYRAVLFSDDYGVLMLGGTKDQKLQLPEGAWKIANYTIDATAFTGGARTAVTATFGSQPASLTVTKGESAKLPFGAPYRAVVTARRADASKVYLALSIVGSGGEQCTNFYINGSRPPEPLFVIKDESGKTIHQGKFEWG